MPLYSARPPQTPPSIVSEPLRRSWGRGRGPGVCSVDGEGDGVAEVMRQACPAAPSVDIGEAPDPSLVLPSRESPEGVPAAGTAAAPTDDAVGAAAVLRCQGLVAGLLRATALARTAARGQLAVGL